MDPARRFRPSPGWRGTTDDRASMAAVDSPLPHHDLSQICCLLPVNAETVGYRPRISFDQSRSPRDARHSLARLSSKGGRGFSRSSPCSPETAASRPCAVSRRPSLLVELEALRREVADPRSPPAGGTRLSSREHEAAALRPSPPPRPAPPTPRARAAQSV